MSKVIEIVPYRGLPCEAEKFTVGGIDADKSDFGHNTDFHPEDAEDYACGSNQFEPLDAVPDNVLSKYNISEDEYRAIQRQLESTFYIGSCGWCV